MMFAPGCGPRGLLAVFHPVDNRSDVGQPHGSAVAVSNDQRTIAVAGNQLIVCADGVGLVQAVKSAFGLIDVGRGEGSAQIFETQAIRRQGRRIGLYAYRWTLAATDADETDTA
jgi:hypothetical protein